MRRAHVGSIVCGAMFAVACGKSSPQHAGFSSDGSDASFNFDASALGMSDGGRGSDGGGDGGRGAGSNNGTPGSGSGDAAVPQDAGPGADGGCPLCPAPDVCCSDPTSLDFGVCYSPACVGCCQSRVTSGGSCAGGASCGSNESCCTVAGSVQYGKCYPSDCASCCPGGSSSSDAGNDDDAGVCGDCATDTRCCANTASAEYGLCVPVTCAACCR